jgi:hypothetical protein
VTKDALGAKIFAQLNPRTGPRLLHRCLSAVPLFG